MGVKCHHIVDALPSSNEAVLGVVSPFADGGRHEPVVNYSEGFAISIFKSEWACAISGAVGTVTGVLIQRTFWEKDTELVSEVFWWEASVAHVAISAMEDLGTLITSCVPAAIWYTIWARGAVFRLFPRTVECFLVKVS